MAVVPRTRELQPRQVASATMHTILSLRTEIQCKEHLVLGMSLRESRKMEFQPGLTGLCASLRRDDQRAARFWAENQQTLLAA